MGSGTFDSGAYAARAASTKASGADPMAYNARVKSGAVPKAVHDSLNILLKPRRECRDNVDNPTSTPVSVFLDVTGSMGNMSYDILNDFPHFVSILQETGAVSNPAVLFGAVGDHKCDQVPIQIGEFEASDELLEQNLTNIFLEGNGGGNGGESYWLPLAFAAKQVETDHYEKRGKKGHLIIIADEPCHSFDSVACKKYLGIDMENMSMNDLATLVQEKWYVYILRPTGSAYSGDSKITQQWKDYGFEHVYRIEDWKEVVPTCSALIAQSEGIDKDTISSAIAKTGLTIDSNLLSKVEDAGIVNTVDIADSGSGLTRV